MKLDDHYTPIELARIAIGHVALCDPAIVADMAAGEGSLLLEAARRWPTARIVATDIDRRTVSQLARMNRRNWKVGRCDFLGNRSRSASRILRKIEGNLNLLLMNPPFSCRGGSYRLVDTQDGPVRASLAMAFLLLGLRYLSSRGQAVAILPVGCLHNRKDELAWQYIRKRFAVRELARWDNNTFPGCAASSVLVKLTALKPSQRTSV
jgi:type I restriction-modification system DNA methylase subunit